MLRKLLLIGAAIIATPAHACLGPPLEHRPLRYEPIRADVAPVVAKITVIQQEFDKPTRPYVMFRVKVEQMITGDLPAEVVMAVRYATSCDRYPNIGNSGYVAGELYEGVFFVASWTVHSGKIDTTSTPDLRPHLPSKGE